MCNLGRLWLLAHALDHKGQGWIDVAEFRKRFTTNPSYICGDRRMRQLLNEGDGQMWTISNGRMWLTGAYKLARLLEKDLITVDEFNKAKQHLLNG